MYKIEIPKTIYQLMGIFDLLGMWSNKDRITFGELSRKLFYFVYFVCFLLSIAVGALITEDNDERVYLSVISVILVVLTYRMWIILWQKNRILLLVKQNGIQCTNDREEFIQIHNKLENFMQFVRYFLLAITTTSFFDVVLFPIANKKLIFNIAFPVDRHNKDVAFWIEAAFLGAGFSLAAACTILNNIIWYLLLSISYKYKILGNQLRHLGTIMTEGQNLKVSLVAQQKFFFKEFIAAMQLYDKINGSLEEFASYFGNLFFLQVATGSICICGSVYTLAFSSHQYLIQDGFYCIVLAYSIFDIFMVMYLGNEIQLSSGKLSHCLYESNWIEQTQSCKKCIIIMMERLKRPQELIVGKLYRLNLLTFTSIVHSAYTLFNILQNFR